MKSFVFQLNRLIFTIAVEHDHDDHERLLLPSILLTHSRLPGARLKLPSLQINNNDMLSIALGWWNFYLIFMFLCPRISFKRVRRTDATRIDQHVDRPEHPNCRCRIIIDEDACEFIRDLSFKGDPPCPN